MQILVATIKMTCGVIGAAMSLLFTLGVTVLGLIEWDSPRHGGDWPSVILRGLVTLAMLFCSAFTFRSGVLDFRHLFSRRPVIAAH